jgi:selenide,water dikinase
MTDVTGFGLLGHLREMCEGSGTTARVDYEEVPKITDLGPYVEAGMIPGGTRRNWASYGDAIDCPDESRRAVLCDPQTSGGILTAIDPQHAGELVDLFGDNGLGDLAKPIGEIGPAADGALVSVR